MKNTQLVNFLKTLGIEQVQRQIYMFLIQNGESTILTISRETGMERTKVYREIERMKKTGYVYERIEYKKTYVRACKIEVLQEEAYKHIDYAKQLERNLPTILNTFSNIQNSDMPTNVKYYKGKNGIKQVLWNQLSAQDEILTFSYRDLLEVVGEKFFRLWKKEYEEKKLKLRELRSESFLKSQTIKSYNPLPIKNDYIKYIDPSILDISTEIDVYNNTIVIFNWFEGDIYAIEITNEKLANMQKQIFNNFWNLGKSYNQEKLNKGYKVYNSENRM
jgi:sugar-specific transcriptional regulator TrmB